MILIFVIVMILMGGLMFLVSQDKKIALMFIGCMTLTLLRVDIPLIKTANSFLVVCFLLSEFKRWKLMVIRWMRKPIGMIFVFVLLSFTFCIIFSPHLHNIKDMINFMRDEIWLKYFALGYAFSYIKNEKSLKTLIRYSIVPMFILTLFGVINLLDHRSFFVTEMMSNYSSTNDINEMAGDKYIDQDRFRVQAMFFNPFDYGYICSLCMIMYLYGFIKKMISKYLFILLLSCCFFGILFCGARTVLFCTLVSSCIFIVLAYKLRRSMMIGLTALIISVIAYMTIPEVNEKVDQMTTIFSDTKGSEVSGSNIEMRTIQYATTLYYIQDNMAFGRGVNFFNIDLGWSEGRKGLIDSRLEGIEGIYLLYLLERGIVGYFLYLMVWIIMFYYIYRHKNKWKELSAFGIAVWSLSFFFSHMTGELLSTYPTLLVLGSILGLINSKELLEK